MLLVIGWDGASPNLVEKWIREGRLPHLAALYRNGVGGRVRAPWPPVTFPSWTTFMTGVNPGKHGVFDFTRRVPGTYRVQFLNATHRRAPSVWSLLSVAGKRVCVLGLPATYPPESVNGIMVSGFDTPVTTRADASFVYPPERAQEVLAEGGFPFAPFQEFRVDDRWYARARDELLKGIEQKTRLAEKFLRQGRWDCFLVLFGESDTVAHHFWHYHDRRSPFFDPSRAPLWGHAVREVYEALDAALGRLLAVVPGANALVISDHGFGGAGTTRVHLNRWLAEHGWLQFTPAPVWAKVMGALKPLALSRIPARWQAWLFRRRQAAWAGGLETAARFRGIDFARSAAFSEELGYFPSVWLNVRGRDPEGRVHPGDYDKVREEIRTALFEWRHPATGRSLLRHVWMREEIYTGPWVGEAPDLLLDFEEMPAGYAVLAATSGGRSGPVVTEIDARKWRGGKLQGLSGTHRREGVFALAGPRAEKVARELRSNTWAMEQFAPVVLRLCGVETSDELFDGETFAPIVSGNIAPVGSQRQIGSWPGAYSEQEEVELAKRLTDLGYLE